VENSVCHVLLASWSQATSSKYTPENPTRGQCGVTTLVVNDFLGGEILKTPVEAGWHFYNRIAGKRMDWTAAQFPESIYYADRLSSREEAFADTNEEQ
jgi:hypothetical protein